MNGEIACVQIARHFHLCGISRNKVGELEDFSGMLIELIRGFFQLLVLLGMVLLSVAFFTLFERKILGFIQVRKGPSKVGI